MPEVNEEKESKGKRIANRELSRNESKYINNLGFINLSFGKIIWSHLLCLPLYLPDFLVLSPISHPFGWLWALWHQHTWQEYSCLIACVLSTHYARHATSSSVFSFRSSDHLHRDTFPSCSAFKMNLKSNSHCPHLAFCVPSPCSIFLHSYIPSHMLYIFPIYCASLLLIWLEYKFHSGREFLSILRFSKSPVLCTGLGTW